MGTNYFWGGRFKDAPDQLMYEINNSIGYDQALYRQDVLVSMAHVKMLGKQGILEDREVAKLLSGLEKVAMDIEQGRSVFRAELEDIHANIEFLLRQEVGDLAGKLHTGRSRNDQVVTDFRMWIRDAIASLDAQIVALQKVFIGLAEDNIDCIMPGFTHLRVAQPVLFSHHAMAYVEMLARDRGRLHDCNQRMDSCPLGCAALAGTSFDIDRHFTASQLSFSAPSSNSIDSISDRDFVLEFISALCTCMMHLSRWAEELILWSSDGFRFITLEDSFTSGSSIMPQKKNPDAAELVRAKFSLVLGSLNAAFSMMKALPLTYNKDMQEDKLLVFASVEQTSLCLRVMEGMSAGLKIDHAATLEFAGRGYSTATDLADWLVRTLNIPFRQSHYIVGKIVRMAEDSGIASLSEMPLEQMRSVEPGIDARVFEVLSVERSVASRNSYGGTSAESVKCQIETAKQSLSDSGKA